MKTGYLLLLFFVVMLAAILGLNLPHEYTPDDVDVNDSDTIPASMMSVPDSDPNTEENVKDERGWWLHKGRSYVSYGGREYTGNTAEIAKVDLVILLNGQDAGNSPGQGFVAGSQATAEYFVTNIGNVSFDDIIVTDTIFGDIGEYGTLEAGKSVSFSVTYDVLEGQFSSAGKVVAFNESTLEACSDEHNMFYYGMKVPVSDIPEFPTILFPMTILIGLALIFGRKE
ncbi:MAG: hypothetical protein Q8J68_09975 [Methanolobus sp.]|uniref:hypothetical protein n=1 Tax=Methanolobus sp. TaxID=1874737 RepID=UPI0027313E8D|nr:hypothetical protein [Methanolobus sp.]MDP2217599.1 hypothetical protein [Methanolobus sp.]